MDESDAEITALRAMLGEAAARAERLEAELRASRALHEATIESLPFDFWARDREGYCVSQNGATRAHWGDLLHRRPEDMDFPPEVIATWLENNRRALAGEIVRGEVDYMVAGETRHVENILAPIRQGAEIVGTLGVNVDLTDLRRAEAERLRLERRLRETQRLETVGLLAGGVAHDINNIVMVIMGMTSLARRHAGGPALDHDLATIETASRRAAEICGQLLAFAGKGRLAIELVDLGALVDETVALLQRTLPSHVTLEVESPRAPRLRIEGDPIQLRQLVMNLILNASEAIGDQPGTISIRLGLADPQVLSTMAHESVVDLAPEGAHALLEVTDTGCGMTAEIRARIFEPFYTTKARGRGLGLAAALGTVRGHAGALAVVSEPGAGATFRVVLPCVEDEAHAPAPPEVAEDWRGTGTVLIVDDDHGVATAVARMMCDIGFDVIVAISGQEALTHVAAHPGLVLALVDLMMPGLGGAETCALIHAQLPDLPVILMSGFHDLAEPPPHTRLLAKPFTYEVLHAAVRAAVTGAPS